MFAAGDPDFAAFLELLKDETPDERIPASFCTEREMFNEEWSSHDRLIYYMKAGRLCKKLILENTEREIALSNVRIKMREADGNEDQIRVNKLLFSAVKENGTEIPFEEKDVADIL